MALLKLEWSAFRWRDSDGEWVGLRFRWSERPELLRAAELLFLRIAAPELERASVGIVVAGTDGVTCPVLPGGRMVIPGPALGSTFYVFVPEDQAPGDPFYVQVVAVLTVDGEDEVEELEVDLNQAWAKPPQSWARELTAAKRLLSTGGTPAERSGYMRLVVDALARVEHPQVASLRLAFENNAEIEDLPRDMRPLARPGAVLELAYWAEMGDVATVERGIAVLPAPLRETPSVLALLDVARRAASRPDAAARRTLAEAERARRGGQFSRCVELCDRLLGDGAVSADARYLRLHAVADAIEAAIRRADPKDARDWLEKERATLEAEVGAQDPWLMSIDLALDGAGDAVEEAELVDSPIALVNTAARAVWSRVQTWLKPRRETWDDVE